MNRPALAVLFAALGSSACAQTAFTVDAGQRRQTIEGLGFTATGTWIPEVRALYASPDFARQVSSELGPSIVRLALPPAFQISPDLDAARFDAALFDPKAFNPPANFIQELHRLDPRVKVMLSIWSPPAWMKDNEATVGGGHLRADRRAHFGKYCAAACKLFEETYGVPVCGLSIQNEPVFVEKYDSCVYTPGEMRDTIKAVAAAFETFGVKTRIMAPEDVHDTARIMTFVDAIRKDEVALAAVSMFNVHGIPSKGWTDLRDQIAPLNKPLWLTETSGQSPDWNGGLAVATEIHKALTLGECGAWVYWALTDPNPDEFALMSLNKGTGKYWAASGFFKFVRPGSVRIAVTPSSADILASAFIHDADHTITLILVDVSPRDVAITVSLQGAPAIGEVRVFRSMRDESCLPRSNIAVVNGRFDTIIKAQSVTTFQGRFGAP